MNKTEVQVTDLTVPDLAKLAKKGPVILTRNGRPLVSVKDVPDSTQPRLR
jgi:hypothetical protein